MYLNFHNLSHRLLRGVLLVAGGASLALGLLFLGAYRSQLVEERAAVSLQLNRMLQVTWENAMLKRDVDGLRDIVASLGQVSGISDVLILEPAGGEVRFASDPAKLGRRIPEVAHATQAGMPLSRFEKLADSGEVLRSINPVPNRAACVPCHGAVESHPINGVLVIDYDAVPIRASALRSAVLLTAAGAAVLALTLLTLWLLLRRHVIRPLAALDAATRGLAGGDLTVRAAIGGDDEIARTAAGFNDMAERLAGQIALAEAQQRFLQTLLDGLPDGVRLIRVSDMRVTLANRTFCQQLGLPAEAVVGSPCYRHSHGRDEPCVTTLHVCPVAELREIGESVRVTHHHRYADGREFPAEVHAVLIELAGGRGRERYIVESVRDIGQLTRISHEQRLSELGMLAAGIAHEIHNPLGSIRLGVQGLLREVGSGDFTAAQVIDYMELIDQEIDSCIAVTRRLLLLARPPANSMELVALGDALNDTLRLLEFDAHSHNIDQHLEAPQELLRVLADEAEVRMIFLNLIQNAHHAMAGGGTLTARLRRDEGMAVIEIADTGTGLDAQQAAHIFDPFYSRRADGVSGTGLGLTIVKNFVQRMGGTIAVESIPGEGSCFHLRLALAETVMENRT